MAEWMTRRKAPTARRGNLTGPLSRGCYRDLLSPQMALGLLYGIICGVCGCVRQDGEPATGLVRRAQQIETLIVTPVTSEQELLGTIDVGVREISRLARRGTVVAMQAGSQIVLLDLASAPGTAMDAGQSVQPAAEGLATLPTRRVGGDRQAVELMYGPTQAGFAVLTESGTSGLPMPAWLDDDSTLRPIATGLPAEMGVQCWLPLTSRGDVLLLAAGAAGEKPQLWMSRAGKCARFTAADTAGAGGTSLLDGYFLLVPSGDGSLVGAVRDNAAGVYAEVFDIVQHTRLYTLRLAEFGNRNVPAGRNGWNPRRRGEFVAQQAGDVSHDSAGFRLAAHPLAWAIGPAAWSGTGGVAGVPLRSLEDGAVRLFGWQVGAVVRLPAQVSSVSEWSSRGVVGWAMGLGNSSIVATSGQSVVEPGGWALGINSMAVSNDGGGVRSGGVFGGGQPSGMQPSEIWSVSEGPSLGLGLAGGGVAVIQRVSPGLSAFFRVSLQ